MKRSRTRQALGDGCSRTIPDTYHSEPDNWREAIYESNRPLHMRKVKQRVDRWLQHGY